MPVIINGSTGVSGTDGSAGTPAVQGTDTNTGMFFPAANQIAFAEDGVEAMRLDANGNVGIGTTTMGYRLVVSSNGGTDATFVSAAGGAAYVGAVGAKPLIFETSGTERLRIDTSGNVGIGGPAAAGTRLEVVGPVDATTSAATGFGLRLRTPSGSGSPAILQFTNNPVTQQWGYVATPAQNVMTFGGNSEYARFNSSGIFLIGRTSSAFAASTGIYLDPLGTGVFERDSESCLFLARVGGNSNGSIANFYWGSGRAFVGNIAVQSTGTSYNSVSDYRLKENVTPLTGAAARVQALKPSRFNFIADPDRTVDGFLAHEAAEVVPEAVQGEKDAVNEDGSIKAQGIDQSKLVPLLTAALQEALTEIAALKARVAALEATP